MTPDQITAWAAAGESETLELKRTTGERREGTRTVCAMLNHRGGRVLFGVEPVGRVLGQQVSDHTLEEIAQELQQLDPPAFPNIDRVALGNGREVLVVSVSTGQNRPYCYRGQAYRRVGNTSLPMSRDEYNRMLLERVHGEHRWENQPASGWSVSALDLAEITRTIEEAIRRGRIEDPGTREPKEILRGLNLIRDGVLMRAALVLFGRAERLGAELPQCLLRVARFFGTDKTEFLDNRQFRGHAFELLLAAERFLRQHVPVAGRVVPERLERIDEPLYPPLAVREALANAFCHRDYSIGGGSVGIALYDDRLEITSSGTLHFGLTPEALFGPHESMPWNPLIAGAFYRRGIIETWGRGTIKMAQLTQQAGLPKPEIEDAGGCVTVRFRPTRYVAPRRVTTDLTERQRRVLAYLAECPGGAAVRDVAGVLGEAESPWTIREDLAAMKSLGLVRTEGWGRGARWRLVDS
ncbi:MAG: AAA family ATPase [Thermoanaerobaculia bacterium]|nr:AAA family ATPase [Thermoanaerobaculia bacterium]